MALYFTVLNILSAVVPLPQESNSFLFDEGWVWNQIPLLLGGWVGVLRTADNHIYLIDFGIARHFKPGKAKDTIPLGSKGYAAPEQYGKAQTTAESDIYGLGATLHQLLTGDDPSLTLFHFEPLHLKDSPISSRLNDLLSQMVQMKMEERPASMLPPPLPSPPARP